MNLINPPSLFMKLSSPNTSNALSILQPPGLTLPWFFWSCYFNVPEIWNAVFGMASLLLPVSPITPLLQPNWAFSCTLWRCQLEKSNDLYFSAYLLCPVFSRPPMVQPGLQHFPIEDYTPFQNYHSPASSFKWDLTLKYFDYSTLVWRALLPLYFIEDDTIQNN